MKIMTFKVAVIAFFAIMISQLVIGFILGAVWAFLDEYYTKNEGNSFLRKIYCWFDESINNHNFVLLVCQMIIIAAVLSILSVIF